MRADLTQEQIDFAVSQTSRWLRIRANFDKGEQLGQLATAYPDDRLTPALLTQVAADVDHSALLRRLLSGLDPLPEPPPLKYSYPVYPDAA